MKSVKDRTSERRRRGLTVSPPPVALWAEAPPTPKWPSLEWEEPAWSARVREREAEAGDGMKAGLAGFETGAALPAPWRDLRSSTWRWSRSSNLFRDRVANFAAQDVGRARRRRRRRFTDGLLSLKGNQSLPAARSVALAVRLMLQPHGLSAFAQAPRTQKPRLMPAKTPRSSRLLREAALQHYKGN